MKLLRNRPLAICCMAFLAALVLSAYLGSQAMLCIGLAALLFVSVLTFLKKAKRLLLLTLAVALLASVYGYFRYDRYFAMADAHAGQEVSVTAYVEEITYHDGAAYGMTLRAEEIEGEIYNGRISAFAYTKAVPERGTRIRFFATLSAPQKTDSLSLYQRASGIAAVAEDVSFIEVIGKKESTDIFSHFARLRERLSLRFTAHLMPDSGAVMSALLFGEQDLLPDGVMRDFRRTGLSHILSLSGLHLTLLTGALAIWFFRLGIPKSVTAVGQILLVLFYMALTGFSLSITRSGLMMLLFCLSYFVRKQVDGITSLSFAAAAIAVFMPMAVYDCGFWLSVFATLGILLRGEWHRGQKKKREKTFFPRLLSAARDALGVTLSANFATLPLIAFYFGEFSLISPLCNLLFVPLFNFYLLLSLPVLLLAPLPFIAGPIEWMTDHLLRAVSWFASLPHIVVPLGYLPMILLLLLSAAVMAVCLLYPRIGRRTTKRAGLICLLAVLLCGGVHQIYQSALCGVAYTHIGQSEVLLLQDRGNTLMADLSNGSYTAQKNALQIAKERGVTELHGYMITHYHTRHAESFPRLCGRIRIRTLYLPIPQNEEQEAIYRTLCEAAEADGITAVLYEGYDELPFGRLTLIPHEAGKSPSSHPTMALSVRREECLLTYLSNGCHESTTSEAAAYAVGESAFLIFGRHGGKEYTAPSYRHFSPTLQTVLLPREDRLSPDMTVFLSDYTWVVREGESIFLPLN